MLPHLNSCDSATGEGSAGQRGKWNRQMNIELFTVAHDYLYPRRKIEECHTCNIYSVTFWDLRIGKLERCYATLKPWTLIWVIGLFSDSVRFDAYAQRCCLSAMIYFRGSEA